MSHFLLLPPTAGQDKPYVKEVELQTVHDALYIQAFEQFDEIATMGEFILVYAC